MQFLFSFSNGLVALLCFLLQEFSELFLLSSCQVPFKVPYESNVPYIVLSLSEIHNLALPLCSSVDRVFRPDPGPMSTLQKSVRLEENFLFCLWGWGNKPKATLYLEICLFFLFSSSIGRRYPRRRSLLCFLLFIFLVSCTVGLMVRLVMLHNDIMFQVLIRIPYLKPTFCSSGCSGGHVEACQGLQRHLRLVGAGDAAGCVHHGTNYLLELSENQQSHNQHHID